MNKPLFVFLQKVLNKKEKIFLNFLLFLGEGSSEIIRSILCKNGLFETFPGKPVRTLYENFQRSVERCGNKPCMGWRENDGPYKWITYEQAWTRSKNFGSGLTNLGVKPKDFVGIYSINRVEWVVSEQAVNAWSLVLVPLYDTLGSEACQCKKKKFINSEFSNLFIFFFFLE